MLRVPILRAGRPYTSKEILPLRDYATGALVADVSVEKDRSRAYGWMTSAQFGGLVAGPMLAMPLYALGGGSGDVVTAAGETLRVV